MKYDSSMTQFHGDIVSAIKSMIHGDIDKVAELAAEGSPVPLRDYLKEQYGRRCCVGNEFEGLSNAFRVKFDHMINSLGDTKLQLSWSQTTGFIRKYPSEFFSEEESADEILPDKNSLELLCNTFDESKIECPFWRTGQTMRYVNIGGVDFKCDYCECSFCEFDKLTEFLASHCHDYEECLYYRKHKDDKSDFPCEDCGHDKHGCCDYPDTPDDYCVCGDKKIPAPAQTEAAAPAVFDYSALDTDTAHSLKACETVIRTETAGYFTLLGAKFKEAQELLANHSSGTFEQWYTSIGFKRQTVYNLIQRYEFSSSPTIGGREEAFEALPLTLSYEISKPAAPAELVEKVLDGDITTNAEYRKLKAELEEAEEKKEFWIKTNSETNKENQQLRADRNIALSRADNAERKLSEAEAKIKELNEERERNAELEERDDVLQRKNDVLVLKNQELEQRVKELENRPVEVAVQSDEEALAEKDQEISELKEEIERLSDKDVKVFAIRLTLDEFEKLSQIVSGGNDPRILEAVRKAQLIRL